MSQIKEIFKSLKTQAVNINFFKEYVLNQRFGEANAAFGIISAEFAKTMEFLADTQITDEETLTGYVVALNDALMAEDLVLLSDLLEQLIKPVLESAFVYLFTNYDRCDIGLAEECQADGDGCTYVIEYNNCGEAVMARCANGKKLYFHSNICAVLEGYRFAKCYVNSGCDEYIVLGLGLGYHVAELEKYCHGARIVVYEPSETVIEMHRRFGVPIKSDIIWDRDFSLLAAGISGDFTGKLLAIHRPTLISIENEGIRKSLENFFWVQNSIQDQKSAMEWNFRNNIKINAVNVWQLKSEFAGREAVLVAGGPSLDDDIKLLCDNSNRYIVVCAGTVYKKLLGSGIKPDYVVIIDVKDNMQSQILDTASDSGLIFLSSANHKACKEYQGNKYIAYQEGFEPAEEKARYEGIELFETGGSVSCFMVDMLIRMGVKKVICLGLDLAYTNGLSHASQAAFSRNVTGSRKVKSVAGDMIDTAPNFEIYRKWIEDRISGSNVTFVNTAKGAYIEGMEHISCGKAFEVERDT